MKAQPIRTNTDKRSSGVPGTGFEMGGFLDGKRTYISFWGHSNYLGSLSGQKLYRLAKAIVRQFEREK
jgi:hypothetical protein